MLVVDLNSVKSCCKIIMTSCFGGVCKTKEIARAVNQSHSLAFYLVSHLDLCHQRTKYVLYVHVLISYYIYKKQIDI